MRTFSDHHIERWAGVFLAPEHNRRLRAARISFEQFLRAPEVILARLDEIGLLVAQLRVRARLDLERVADASVRAMPPESRCADGRWTEKTRHHAWPRRRARTEPKEAA